MPDGRVNGYMTKQQHKLHLLHPVGLSVLVNMRHQQTHGREKAVRLG